MVEWLVFLPYSKKIIVSMPSLDVVPDLPSLAPLAAEKKERKKTKS